MATLVEMIKADPKVQAVFQEYEVALTDQIVLRNLMNLNLFLQDAKYDCSDLKKPCERPNHDKVTLIYRNDMFYAAKTKCEHYLAAHPFEKIRRQFIYENINMENYQGSLTQIGKDFRKGDADYEQSMEQLLTTIKKIISADSKKGLLIFGKARVGKTYLLKAIAKKYAEHKKTVVITTFEELCNKIRDAFERDFNVDAVTVEKCKTADILLLDDIGVEKVTKWNRDEVLFPIINYRIEHQKLTFFTSNFTMEELAKHYTNVSDSKDVKANKVGAERIMGRLRELINYPMEIRGKFKN